MTPMISELLPDKVITDEDVLDQLVKASSRDIPTEIIAAWQLEAKGGVCLLCQKPYIPVMVKNRFADFTYYTPDCRCYKRCTLAGVKDSYERRRGTTRSTVEVMRKYSGCGKILVEEKLLGLDRCSNCGGYIL